MKTVFPIFGIIILTGCVGLIGFSFLKDHSLSKKIVGKWESSGTVNGVFSDTKMTFQKDHTLITEAICLLGAATNTPITWIGQWKIDRGILVRLISSDWETRSFENKIIEITPEKLVFDQKKCQVVMYRSKKSQALGTASE